jgi:hypothetical protein
MPVAGHLQVVILDSTLVGTVLAISIVTVREERAVYDGCKRRHPDEEGVVNAATAGDPRDQSGFTYSGGSYPDRFSSDPLMADVLNPVVSLEGLGTHAGALCEALIRPLVLLSGVQIRAPPCAGGGCCG